MASNLSWTAYHNQLVRAGKVDVSNKIHLKAVGKGYDLIKKEGVCDFDKWYEQMKKEVSYEYISLGLDGKYLSSLITYAWESKVQIKEETYPISIWAKLESIRRNEQKKNWMFGTIIGVLCAAIIACLVVIVNMATPKVAEPSSNQIQGLMSDQDVDVYMCTGETATSYHLYRDCMGLSNCSGYLLIMSRSDAERRGRHLCGFCKNR